MTTQTATRAAAAANSRRRTRALHILPYAIALFSAIWALRGVEMANTVDTDAARHAMNGAFLHDLIRDGQLFDALDYARTYYSHYPALSMPYHPPVFPAIESLFYFVFGVNLLAARLAVAAFTAVSFLLLYRLVLSTHGSRALAFLCAAVFFFCPVSQRVAGDVMLEMPALAFTLGALFYVRDLPGGFPFSRAIPFALLAGAAYWTKQNSLFLAAVPFAYAILSGRLRILARWPVWISAALYGTIVAALSLVSIAAKAAGNSTWPTSFAGIVTHNTWYYAGVLRADFTTPGAILIVTAFAAACIGLRRDDPNRDGLYVAWILAVAALVIVLPPYDARYLWFAYPAMILLAFSFLSRVSARVAPELPRWAVPAFASGLAIILFANTPRAFLEGPENAARFISAGAPGRVLYCGKGNGAFIFSMRQRDPALQSVVIRGDKLPASIYQRDQFEQFAHRYGITRIVLERRSMRRPWDAIDVFPAPSMKFVVQLPLRSSDPALNGSLRVYEFTNPSAHPENTLELRSMSGADLEVQF